MERWRENPARESFYPSPLHAPAAHGPDRAEGRTVAEVMVRAPVAVDPDDDMAVAARMFLEHRVHALPVVEDGRLVGVVSRFDLLRCLCEDPRVVIR